MALTLWIMNKIEVMQICPISFAFLPKKGYFLRIILFENKRCFKDPNLSEKEKGQSLRGAVTQPPPTSFPLS